MLQITSRGLRRFLVGAAASVVVVSSWSAAPTVAYARGTGTGPGPEASGAGPFSFPSRMPPPLRDEDRTSGDHLTVTVRDAGRGKDGTYELYCHPGGGSHPHVRRACRVLDRGTRWGTDPFAPAPEGDVCTMQYGGPATAHVTGTWAGRPVDATYDRSDGCETARWDRLVPLLPDLRAQVPVRRYRPAPAQASHGGHRDSVNVPRRSRAGRATRSHVPHHFVVRAPSHPASRAQPQRLDSLA